MSLKTFINKYKNGTGNGSSCSQSSIGCYSQASTSSLSCLSQSNKQPPQNNLNLLQLSQGMSSSGFLRGNSNTNNRMSVIQEEQVSNKQRQNSQIKNATSTNGNTNSSFQQYPNNISNFQNNSSNLSSSFSSNNQQNMLNSSFSNENMHNTYNNNNLNSSKIFMYNNANMINSSRVNQNASFNNTLNYSSTDNNNNSINMQAISNYNTPNNQNLNYPPQLLNQSQMQGTTSFQPILPQELTPSNGNLPNTILSTNNNNNYQHIGLNISSNPQSFEDYLVKSKATQKARENKMKIDLLKEIHGVKEFFQETILKELSNLATQTINKCKDYQNNLSELQDRVEVSAKVVNAFIEKSEFTDENEKQLHRQKIVDSEYGKDLSELHDLVIKARQTVEQSDQAMSQALDKTLTQSAKAISIKIDQTKKSLKKQILIQIKADQVAQCINSRTTRFNGKRKVDYKQK